MKKCLFICSSHMQVIVAIQLKLQVFKDSLVDIIVTDSIKGAYQVYEGIKKTGLFNNIVYAEYSDILFGKNTKKVIVDTLDFLSCGRNYKKMTEELDFPYDKIFYYNISTLLYYCFDKSGKDTECSRMEEGIFSYNDLFKAEYGARFKTINMIRKVLVKENPFISTNEVWVFFPEMVRRTSEKMKIKTIPLLSRDDTVLKKALNQTYDYNVIDEPFPKYIYFSSSNDIDGMKVDEDKIVEKIAELVGKENFEIKVHPRDKRTVYSDMGLKISKNTGIPWEVVQMNHDFSNSVFLTLSSGSVLNSTIMLNDHVETLYLFPLVRGKDEKFDARCESTTIPLLKNIIEQTGNDSFKIINSFDDLNKRYRWQK